MRLLVTGATGQIGGFMLPILIHDLGAEVVAVSRNPHGSRFGESWKVCDMLSEDPFAGSDGFDAWVHLGFLSQTLPWFESARAAGVTRFVGFSSTSVFTKVDSSSPKERKIIGDLIHAEDAVKMQCESTDIGWTILRPTMIYGAGRDQNVTFVEGVIRRFGIFPLVGGGKGKRMPVHARDLALAAAASLQTEAARNRAYNLGGGETITYREFVAKIFAHLGKKPRFLPMPLFLARLLASVASRLPAFKHVTPAMFERMRTDLVFDYSDAVRDLDYHPAPFTLQ